jgi:Protein of unknown function (DUF3769)/Lipopolysaccharide-assembly, LptC-related
MGTNSVGKQSNQFVGQRVSRVARYLCLCTCCSIGISLRPAIANPLAAPAEFGLNRLTSIPLTYQIVQDGAPGAPPTTNLYTNGGTVELNADQQEFNNNTQIIYATGKVVLRFNKAVLNADRLRVDLRTKIATAEGNVSLIRGQQILYGNRFDYNFEDDKGSIAEARGDIFQPTLVRDLNILERARTPAPAGDRQFPEPVLSERLRNDQPITSIQNTSTSGVAVGSDQDIPYQPTLKPKGTITRLRFQADKVDFVGDRIDAEKIRVTNDPFSPPELQIKADRAQFRSINSDEDEVVFSNPQVRVENSFDLPIPRNRLVFNKLGKDANSLNFGFGFDSEDRGGVFFEQNYYPIFDSKFRMTITPQYFIQRAITGLKPIDSSVFGVKTSIEANVSPDTTVLASAALSGFDTSRLSNNFRGKISVNQNVNVFSYQHLLVAEANYRDRIFNNSLGLQDVQSTIGAVLYSPNIPIGNTGVNFDYLLGAQVIEANTDRQNLLRPNRTNNLVTLNRYQSAANLTKSFRLWEGKGLSPNDKATYNYSPVPVIPYLQLNTGIRSAINSYSNGDNQSLIGYSIGIQGQVGNFSRPSFDYTGFNLNYFQQFPGTNSPFLFDRIVDNRVLSAGLNQQIFGPVRLGIQSSLNLDTGRQISTDYYLEYSRRSYNVILRYNPNLGLASIGFRLNDFNWDGITPRF